VRFFISSPFLVYDMLIVELIISSNYDLLNYQMIQVSTTFMVEKIMRLSNENIPSKDKCFCYP